MEQEKKNAPEALAELVAALEALGALVAALERLVLKAPRGRALAESIEKIADALGDAKDKCLAIAAKARTLEN